MRPEQGKILVIHNDPDIQKKLRGVLEVAGFEVVGVTTKLEAFSLVLALGDLGVGAVLITGNLSPLSGEGEDGKDINAAIKSVWGDDIKTAGIDGDPILGADIEVMNIDDTQTFREELDSL